MLQFQSSQNLSKLLMENKKHQPYLFQNLMRENFHFTLSHTSHEARAIDTAAGTGACERMQPAGVVSQFLRRNVALLERSG